MGLVNDKAIPGGGGETALCWEPSSGSGDLATKQELDSFPTPPPPLKCLLAPVVMASGPLDLACVPSMCRQND